MKYKLIGAIAVAAALAAAVLVPALMPDESDRVHQHLVYQEKAACTREHAAEELCTHLPLVVIDTEGVEIPGKPLSRYTNEDGRVEMKYTMAADGDTRISASMKIIDNEDGYNHADDVAAVETDIRIRVRGRSSRSFAKSSYAIKLVNKDQTNNNQRIMGMDAHHDWVLYGPYLDKTDLRNYMFYNISGEIMDYAPNVRYCEVILNGQYQGLYLMVETITAGDNGSRLEIEVNKKYQTYTGYVVRIDQNGDTEEHADSFTGYTYRRAHDVDFEIVYPGDSKLTPELDRSIAQDFSDFEKALYSYDYDSDTAGYKKYIDVESFIDAFLISEITANYDFGGLSTYVYKSIDNRLRVCMWDFNNSCDNFDHPVGWRSFELEGTIWYVMLMRDEDFTERVIARYRSLREKWFSDAYITEYIDETAAFLDDAIDRDRARWADTYASGHGLHVDESRNPQTYDEALDQLKRYLYRRLEWLDENIESLRQYSAESKVKKFSEVAN